MQIKLLILISTFAVTTMLSGCVSVKARVADRERVDQDLPAGADELYPNRAKTRQVIVVEVAQKVKMDVESGKVEPVAVTADEGQSQVVSESKETVVVHDSNFTFPTIDPSNLKQSEAKDSSMIEEYVVQKDDTLQKIAKKLYGSYSKWTVIYDANRDVIKDPNFLKPGKTLQIPVISDTINQGESR